MPQVWDKDVPDWEELKLIPWVIQARGQEGVPAHALDFPALTGHRAFLFQFERAAGKP